ncbi:MAG: 4Fe-4S single cluster domain-containing protein [Microthrixaceae bacterium]
MHYPVDVLGPGHRIGIWLQGCDLACRGCVSRDTWDPEGGTSTTVAALVDRIAELACGQQVDGVTISGGEPFQQPVALFELVVAVRDRLDVERTRPVDVMVYSGLSLGRLREDHARILDVIDAVVPEPFIEHAGEGPLWAGSANQRVVPLTPLGVERFDAAAEITGTPRIQMAVDDQVWMVGIPRRGDMDRLTAALAERGVVLHGASWWP